LGAFLVCQQSDSSSRFRRKALNLHPPASPPEDNEEFLWEIHKYTNEYIRFADAKGAFVAAASTALIGSLVASSLFDSLFKKNPCRWGVVQWIGVAGLLLLTLSLIFAVLVIRPRLWNQESAGYIFWESIAGHKTPTAYSEATKKLAASERSTAISTHLFTLASVAKRKYRYVNLAVISAMVGGMLTGVVLFIQHALR
jgi:hypothetical protein